MGRPAHATKIRAAVVDDEPLARKNLVLLLGRDPDIELTCECGSGIEAITLLRGAKPDLLFLDVQMPECDGFDVLELLGSDVPTVVIFVTAYDQYALRAFETGALDYLLKPFDNARFDRALARAKQMLSPDKPHRGKPERLIVKSAGQVLFITIAHIDWIDAADYYSALHVGAKTHLIRRTITELEQDLDQARFCRVHRGAIVNLDRVQRLAIGGDGDYSLLLDGGPQLRVSRRYRKQIQSRLGQNVPRQS